MRRALDLAAVAAEAGEVPVGAVITLGGESSPKRATRCAARSTRPPMPKWSRSATPPRALGQPRLDGCTLWVTLEPCAMCAAAIALARIAALRFAAEDPKGGGVVHGARIFTQPTCHHRPDVLGGIGEAEAAAQLRAFFAERAAERQPRWSPCRQRRRP